MLDQDPTFESATAAEARGTRARNAARSVAARIDAIRSRHRSIDRTVEAEQARPLPDADVLRALKRKRLRLKDEMRSYEGLLRMLARDPGTHQGGAGDGARGL